MIYILAVLAFVFTFLGGVFALKFKDKLHLIAGFSAGAVLGLAFFDLIPEALEISEGYFDASQVMTVFALAFIAYTILDRMFLHHSHGNEEVICQNETHGHKATRNPMLGVGALSLHSLFDGLAIGLSFQVSISTGIIVAIAVLAHDFSDGINTVNFVLKNEGDGHEHDHAEGEKCNSGHKKVYKWLLVDSIAPVIGVVLGSIIILPDNVVGIIVAAFAGFFTYLGASELLPESYHNHPSWATTLMTVLGMGVIYSIIKLGELGLS